jgi:hypothetical protein
MKLKPQTSPTYPKPHILNLNKQTKNFDDDGKHNLQAKKPEQKWHTQNPNITTVEMLMAFCSNCVMKCERVNFVICDSNGYVTVSVAWYTDA